MNYQNSQVRSNKPHRNRTIASSNVNKEHGPLEKFFAGTYDVKFHNECSTMNGEVRLKTESMVKENSTKNYVLDVKGGGGRGSSKYREIETKSG